MNPKPFSGLNHFTVPFATGVPSFLGPDERGARCGARRPSGAEAPEGTARIGMTTAMRNPRAAGYLRGTTRTSAPPGGGTPPHGAPPPAGRPALDLREEDLVEVLGQGPRALAGVREDGVREPGTRIVDGAERHARVVPVEFRDGGGRVEPEAQTVAGGPLGHVAVRPEHLGDERGRHDPAVDDRAPERGDVRGGRVEASVAASPDGQVEDVAPQALVR